ncbi:F-box/LRR-repeat protein At4g14103-like [Carex rostrata]
MMEGQDLAIDRISDLPDPLLTHILSYIPTEEAVCTCILSKRWIKVWPSLRVLVFDDYIPQSGYLTEGEYRQREAKFLRFLDGVMFNRESTPLDTFKLAWTVNQWNTHILVCRILRCAVMSRPRLLSIHINTDTVFDLPNSIYTCTSIEEMSLWLEPERHDPHNDNFIGLRSINLPFLKKLELGNINLDDNLMRMLLSGCPLLEELVLLGCFLEMNMISFNVLKKLVLNYCCQCSTLLEISCPGVVTLIIRSKGTEGITLKNMSSLATGDFSFEVENEHLSNLRLLGGLSNVTTLNLDIDSENVMDFLLADIPNCPTLKNLKSLELGVLHMMYDYDWNLVACLLQNSTNLKDLTLHFYPIEDDYNAFRYECLEVVKLSFPGKTVKLVNELVRDREDVEGTASVEITAKIIILECEGEDQGSSSAMVPTAERT